MEFILTGRNISVSDKMREYIEKRLGKLEQYFDKISTVKVVVTLETKTIKKVEAQFSGDRHDFFAEEEADNVYGAIDLVGEALEKQSRRFHNRSRDHHYRQKEIWQERESLESGDQVSKILESFPKPMSLIEAVMQLHFNNFDFLMFNNSDGSGLSVLFRRDDDTVAVFNAEKSRVRVMELKTDDLENLTEDHLAEVKEQEFRVNRLPVDEAVSNMSNYNSNFYIFHNSDENIVNVVYRAADNRVALVKPGWK